MNPHFPRRLSVPVRNHLTGEDYVLRRIDEVEATNKRIEEIVAICNEPKVYSWLFRKAFGSQPYKRVNAEEFFEAASKGWIKNEMFIFHVLTSDGEVSAAIDIKSSNTEYAEIGYWSSEAHRGLMTNTTRVLVNLARKAGFRSLFGRTKKENKDSAGVLRRSGFVLDAIESEASDSNDYYRIELKSENQPSH